MVNYKEKFAEAKTIAVNEGFESTRAEWLFLDVFGWSKTDYLIHKDEQMSLTSINKLDKALDRMITGEPIQYIVGFQSFYGYQYLSLIHISEPTRQRQPSRMPSSA